MSKKAQEPGQAARLDRELASSQHAVEMLGRGIDESAAPAEPLVLGEYAVQAVYANHLSCLAFDGLVTFGSLVNVAKDPELRQSSYDGLTLDGLTYEYTGVQARTVTKESDSSTKDQVIIPMYLVPSDGPAGYPGVIITAVPTMTHVGDGESPLLCQLREVTQRAWANVEEA